MSEYLPNINNLNYNSSQMLMTQIEEYQKKLKYRIDTLDACRLNRIRKNMKSMYLALWFDEAFNLKGFIDLDEKGSEFVYPSKSQIPDDLKEVYELRKWFIENADSNMFHLTQGYCVGKRSTHIKMTTTGWLLDMGPVWILDTQYCRYYKVAGRYEDKFYGSVCKREVILRNFRVMIDKCLDNDIVEMEHFLYYLYEFIHYQCDESGELGSMFKMSDYFGPEFITKGVHYSEYDH